MIAVVVRGKTTTGWKCRGACLAEETHEEKNEYQKIPRKLHGVVTGHTEWMRESSKYFVVWLPGQARGMKRSGAGMALTARSGVTGEQVDIAPTNRLIDFAPF